VPATVRALSVIQRRCPQQARGDVAPCFSGVAAWQRRVAVRPNGSRTVFRSPRGSACRCGAMKERAPCSRVVVPRSAQSCSVARCAGRDGESRRLPSQRRIGFHQAGMAAGPRDRAALRWAKHRNESAAASAAQASAATLAFKSPITLPSGPASSNDMAQVVCDCRRAAMAASPGHAPWRVHR
jgi:hypothetical protein